MKRARVLVVDDKPSFLSLFRRILPSDVEVVCAPDGKRALELVAEERFDVVVSDVRMPHANGLTLLRQIRETGEETEVILMTAYGTIAEAVDAMKEGAAEYLTKPFEPDDAVAAVTRALERRFRRETFAIKSPGQLLIAMPYRDAVAAGRDRTTREYLIALLHDVAGNVTQAAERAGIERESFHRLMKRHGIRAEDFRPR